MKRLLSGGLLVAVWLVLGGATWLQFKSDPADGSAGITVTGLLRQPEGEGPFPAAILLADCDGISPHEREWGVRFAEWGYVVYLLDSFFTRSVVSACDGTPVPVMDDLRGALARLDALGTVDMDRVVVVGWQSGGDVALEWAAQEGSGTAVAFYPSCAGDAGFRRPVLLVLPGAHEASVACHDRVGAQEQAGEVPVRWIVAAGAGAGFDCATCADGYLGGPGGWDEAANRMVTESLRAEIERLLDP